MQSKKQGLNEKPCVEVIKVKAESPTKKSLKKSVSSGPLVRVNFDYNGVSATKDIKDAGDDFRDNLLGMDTQHANDRQKFQLYTQQTLLEDTIISTKNYADQAL